HLQHTFQSFENLGGVVNLDLVHPQFGKEYAPLLQQYDTVFALNVIEHIEDDTLAIRNVSQLLKPGGKLIILVPAYPALHNSFDEELYHYRRYTKSSLTKQMLLNGLLIQNSFHFNFLGILGWWVYGSLLKNKLIPEGPMSWFNRLVPVIKLLDRLVLRNIGLSVIVSSHKRP
ncbi:MAG: class I SAM-dependent methyltransferase, partial [Bacteroidota bacterium]